MLFSTDSLLPRVLRNFERMVVIRLVTRSITCLKLNSIRTHNKVLSIDHSIAGHLFADYERDAGLNKKRSKTIKKILLPFN